MDYSFHNEQYNVTRDQIDMNNILADGLEESLEHSINGRLDESEKILRNLDQDDYRVLFNLGWHDLRHGDFRKGFEGLDKGRWINVFGAPPLSGPIWNGQGLENKTILLRGEGGLGDQILNARFVHILENRGAKVIFSCAESLWTLFAQNGIQCCSTIAAEKSAIYYDYWAPAMSVACMMGYDYDTLPGSPFLHSPGCIPKSDKLRVGIRWGGSTANEVEKYRSIDPKHFEDLVANVDADFYSFQRDENIHAGRWTELGSSLVDWKATAQWLVSMDLVITSCTSVGHMAAALGVDTWIIIPLLSYYTWAVPGPRSAWHDKVSLFRQTKMFDWGGPMSEIIHQLEDRKDVAA